MANDVVAAPTIFVIKARVFYFSPLSDYEMSAVEAWAKFNRVASEISDIAMHEAWQTQPGAAQLLYWSTRKFVRRSPMYFAKLVETDVDAFDIYKFWSDLNIVEYGEHVNRLFPPVDKPSASNTSDQDLRESIYRDLGARYGYSIHQIRAMTRVQQLIMWSSEIPAKKSNYFATDAEYLAWAAANVGK